MTNVDGCVLPLIFRTVVEQGDPGEGVCLPSVPFEIQLFNRRVKSLTKRTADARTLFSPLSTPYACPVEGKDEWHVRARIRCTRVEEYRLFLLDVRVIFACVRSHNIYLRQRKDNTVFTYIYIYIASYNLNIVNTIQPHEKETCEKYPNVGSSCGIYIQC